LPADFQTPIQECPADLPLKTNQRSERVAMCAFQTHAVRKNLPKKGAHETLVGMAAGFTD
jgi:hypothetical protein